MTDRDNGTVLRVWPGGDGLEVVFRTVAGGDRLWVTAQTNHHTPLTIGYLKPQGEAVAVHGSGEGWPHVGAWPNAARALGALVAHWWRQTADTPTPCSDAQLLVCVVLVTQSGLAAKSGTSRGASRFCMSPALSAPAATFPP